MSVASRLRRSVSAAPPVVRVLGLGAFVNSVGNSFIWPLITIYIHIQLGRSLTVAGVVLLCFQACSAVGSLAGGWLTDRFGSRRIMLIGLVSGGLVVLVPALTTSWPLYVASLLLMGASWSLSRPATFALAARSWPGEGRRPFNYLYVANNIGVALGTSAGALVVSYSFRLGFLVAAGMSLTVALLVFRLVPADSAAAATTAAPVAATATAPAPTPWAPILALYAGFILILLAYGQWASVMAVHLQSIGISLPRYGLLWTLNGLLIVLGQPLLSLLLRRLRSQPLQLVLGNAFLLASFALALTAQQYSTFALSMALLTLGEMILWPGIPAAVAQLAPPGRTGFFQGVIDNAMVLGRMLAPISGGLLYDHFGIGVTLRVMLGVLLLPLLCIALYARTRAAALRWELAEGRGA